MGNKKVQISACVHPELFKEIQEMANRENRRVNNMVESLLIRQMKKLDLTKRTANCLRYDHLFQLQTPEQTKRAGEEVNGIPLWKCVKCGKLVRSM
jgi:hypothetical protein